MRAVACVPLYCLLFLMTASGVLAQPAGFNYDETKVPAFDLPDPLVGSDGKPVTSAEQWKQQRRPEILAAFQNEVYGRSPAPPQDVLVDVLERNDHALGGKAIRKQVRLQLARGERKAAMDILIYLPAQAKGPVPTFLTLNFYGNHTVHQDPAILLSKSWMRSNREKGVVKNRATEASRGTSANRWAVEMILKRGYGLATIYYGDIDPDFDDGFENGVHALYGKPAENEWGSIATWAWGLSRALDYFEKDDQIDHARVAVMGHSRLGKTALWAAARDERFALAISNNSGCGGAALSRRAFGETVKRINTSFPHWFCDRFLKYNDNENACPVDQHMLVALIAPRPVYIASAAGDRWADPRGEFLAGYHAAPVFRLLGTDGIGDTREQPPLNQPVMHTIGYHIRSGEHDVTDFDWQAYLDFADRHLRDAR